VLVYKSMETAAEELGTLPAAELAALYAAHRPGLVRTAWMMTGSKEEAEDIVHDAFVRLASGPRPVLEHPAAYLRQVVVNQVRDRRRHRAVQLRHIAAPDGPVLDEGDKSIWQLFQALPLRQRQALVLRYYGDLTLAEVSELLACPLGTAKSLVHRGLENMRKEMRDHG
jgi:RNA polymerase sigma factor (sigma-70 family)